jgi:ABC-type multidrug transport system ATPase subunit
MPLTINISGRKVSFAEDTVFCLQRHNQCFQVAEAIYQQAEKLSKPLPQVVGFVGESFPLLANLSVLENALLAVCYHGIMSKKEALKRFESLADKLSILQYRHHRKDEVPEEVLFKAQLLRAMMPSPEYLFVDFQDSDFRARQFVKDFFEVFPAERPTLILTLVLPEQVPEGLKEVWLDG